MEDDDDDDDEPMIVYRGNYSSLLSETIRLDVMVYFNDDADCACVMITAKIFKLSKT